MQPALNHGENGENIAYKKYCEEELKEYLLSQAEIRSSLNFKGPYQVAEVSLPFRGFNTADDFNPFR